MIPRRSVLVVLLSFLAIGMSGCRYGEEVLGLRSMDLDPRRVFPAFTDAARGQPTWSFDPCASVPSSGSTVSLGSYFEAELPDGWRSDRGSTGWVLSHSGGNAMIVFEPFPASGSVSSLRQFHRRMDRRLQPAAPSEVTTPEITAPEITAPEGAAPEVTAPEGAAVDQSGVHEPAAELPEVDRDGIGRDVSDLVSDVSEDDSIGYRSDPGTFSGWRWLGQCAVPPAGEAASGGETATQSSAGLVTAPASPPTSVAESRERAFLALSRSAGTWQRGEDTMAALQILGTVSLPKRRNSGLHFSIVCVQAPNCSVAPDLAKFLGSIRVAERRLGTGP